MLTTNAINGMLDVINSYVNRITIVSDATGDIDIDEFIYDHTAKQIGYTNAGDKYITVSWDNATTASKSLNTSPSSIPIMFAVEAGKTATHLIFYNSTTSKIFAIDGLDTPITYTNDSPFYMYDYNIEMEESV